MTAKFDAQLKINDSAIKQHQAHARQAETNFKKISLRETETANAHSQELMKNQAVIEAARQSALQTAVQLRDLAKELRELKESGKMQQQQFSENMRTVQSQQAHQQITGKSPLSATK